MSRDWEKQFAQWAKGPGAAEQQRCDNAVGAIRNAIGKSPHLKHRTIRVFVQGSYRNRVNAPKDSDVDVGVLCDETFSFNLPDGKKRADYNIEPASYSYAQFKNELGEALVDYFGGEPKVVRGNKAFTVRETTYHVEADVVPFFEHREFDDSHAWRYGVSLFPDDGMRRIDNYPERLLDRWPSTPQHYENGVTKNEATSRTFKRTVRILKALATEMAEAGIPEAVNIPGFLIECLVWNATDNRFKHDTWDAVVQDVLLFLWSTTKEATDCATWTEVDGIKYLFHETQKWTRSEAHAFIFKAWSYVGIR